MSRARPLSVLALLAILLPRPAAAAGYFVSEVGPKAIGRGGAYVVSPDDPTAMWTNPAGLSNIKGIQFFGDASLVRLQSRFTRSCRPSCAPEPYSRTYGSDTVKVARHPFADPTVPNGGFFEGDVNDKSNLVLGNKGDSVGTVDNQSPGRVVPFFGMAIGGDLIGLPGLGIGVAAYGPNTGGVKYDPAGLQRYSVSESIPLEAFFEAAASYRFSRYFTLGAAAALVSLGTEQALSLSLDKDGRETRTRDADIRFNVREDFIPTMMLGFTSNPIAGLEFGGSFIPPRKAKASGPLKVGFADEAAYKADPDAIPVEFNDKDARATVLMSSPAIARMGVRYNYKPWFDVEVALVREFWSGFRSVRLDIDGLQATALGQTLALPPTVQPKEYRDTWSLRTGGDFNAIPGVLTMRAGAYVEENAIPDETLDVSVADSRKLGLSSGFSLGYFGFRLTGAWQHIFMEPRTIGHTVAVSQNSIPPILGGGNTAVGLGKYWMSQDVGSVGVTVDVGEVAVRVKGAMNGDKGWWRPEGPRDRTLVDAAGFLQKQSNF